MTLVVEENEARVLAGLEERLRHLLRLPNIHAAVLGAMNQQNRALHAVDLEEG